MAIYNVRLEPEDAARAKALRAKGVVIAELVRQTIRAEYERQVQGSTELDVDSVLAEIYAAHPRPRATSRRTFDVHDRKQFREAMARHVRRKR